MLVPLNCFIYSEMKILVFKETFYLKELITTNYVKNYYLENNEILSNMIFT